MKPSRLLALATCAFAFWATSCPAAGESISFNAYRDSNGEITIDGAGVLEIPASAWNNVTASGVPSEVKLLSSDKSTTSTITLETSAHINGIWYLASTWTSVKDSVTKTTGNGQLFFNYMDSYQAGWGNGNGWVSLSSIPFTEYTLYIYPGSEGDGNDSYGTMSAFQVTAGERTHLIKGDGSSATVTASSLTDSWGTNQSFREENSVAPVLTEGVNYLKLTGLSGNLTISYPEWSNPRRAGMAGFQIVNTGNLITGSTYTASPSGTEVTFGSITWAEGTLTAGAFNEATLTLEPGSTLTFTEAVPTLSKLTLVSTGKVTLAVSGEGVTLDTALANVANFDFTGVTELDIGALTANAMIILEGATLTMNAPGQVATLTQNGKLKYAGGEALTEFDIHTAAQNNKTTIIDKTISSVKTSSPSDRNLEGYFAINGSRTIELGENANITVSTRFAMADDGGANPVLNQNGGTITVEGTGTTNTSTTGTAVILGHWAGTPAYNLNKGTLSVANGAIMLGWSGNPTMTVGTSDGEAASAKVIAKGIVSHGASDQGQNGKLVFNPSGVIEVGSLGLDFSNTCKTGAVVELAGGLLKVTDNAPLKLANQSGLQLTADTTIEVASGKTLTVSTPFTGTGALTLTGGGTVDLSALGTNLPKIALLEAGTTLRVAPISQSERLTGSFSASLPLADGATLSGTIEYQDGDTWKAATVSTDGSTATLSGSLSTDATLSGSSWWWDYEFNGSNASTGSDTGTVTLEGSATSYTEADSTGNQELYFQKTPYRDATYPAELTAVMRCQPGDHENTVLIGFGTTYDPGVAIALVTGENPANGDMRLVLILRSGTTVTVTDLVEGGLNVANATTAQHLYAFSIATVADKTQIAVYVDGKRKTLYTHPTTIALGGGFQIGSLYGGVKDNNDAWTTGLAKYPTSGDSGTVDFLRISQEVLTNAAMQAMANAYPYVSAKGTATRTVSTATATWEDATNTPWSQAMPDTATAAQAAPNAGTNVVLSASADTAITLNGTSAVTYESMTFTGTGAVTLSATETSATMLASDLTVSTNLTVPAHRFTAGTVAVDEGKTLTFDCSGLDGLQMTYVLTGYVEPEVAERIAVANTEIAGSPFTYEKAQDSAGSVILRATSVKPLTATVSADCAWSAIEWTWEGNTTPTALGNATSVSDITLTLANGAVISPASALAISGTLTMSGSGLLDLPTGSTVTTTAIGDGTTLQLHQAQAAVVTTRSGTAGTFKFVGGTNGDPLLIETTAFPGAIAVAANSYIKIAHTGGNVKYVVSGEGSTSVAWISGSAPWGSDANSGTKFTNVKLAITGGNSFWMRAGSTENVWLDITQNNSVTLENKDVNNTTDNTRLVVRGLTGSGTIQKGNNISGDRYVCLHNPDEAAATFTRSGTINVPLMFTGAWSISANLPTNYPAITVGDGTLASSLTLSGQNGDYTGKTITIAQNATLESTGTVNVPFGKGANAKIVNNGTLRVASVDGQIPPVSGTGNVEIGANCRLAGALTTTGTLTVPATYTLTLGKTDTFDGTPAINGPSVVCAGSITSETVTIASGETLSGTGSIGSALTFADGAKLDVTDGALTATGTVTIADGGTVTVDGATASTTTILTCPSPEALIAQLIGAPEGYLFAANAEKTAVVLVAKPAVEIPPVPGESGSVELSANSKSVLQAVAEANSLDSVSKVSGSTTVNGTPTTLTAEAIDNALAVFGESVVTVDGTELKVDYHFGIVAIEPSYLQGNLSMLTVKVKVTTADGTLATLADGATLELVDGTTVLLDVGAGFYPLTTGEYAGYFYPVDTERDDGQTANGLIGRSFKVRAKR